MRTPKLWQLPTEPCSRAILMASGVTDAMLRTQLRSGRLIAVRHGIFLDADAWPDEPGAQHLIRSRAEVVACPEAVLSHQSAAVAWGLPTPGFELWQDQPVAVTLPQPGHCSYAGKAIRHTGPLPADQVVRDSAGYRITSPARTAVDLADGRSLPEALVLMDAAARLVCSSLMGSIRRRDYNNPRLITAARESLTRAAATRGRSRLDAAIALVEPSRESAPESLSAGHIHLAGLPLPRFQPEIRTPAGSYFPDCLWDEQRLIGECDGAVKYNDANAYVLEKDREQNLRDRDYRFVRWQAKEIMLTPSLVIERIARAIGQ